MLSELITWGPGHGVLMLCLQLVNVFRQFTVVLIISPLLMDCIRPESSPTIMLHANKFKVNLPQYLSDGIGVCLQYLSLYYLFSASTGLIATNLYPVQA